MSDRTPTEPRLSVVETSPAPEGLTGQLVDPGEPEFGQTFDSIEDGIDAINQDWVVIVSGAKVRALRRDLPQGRMDFLTREDHVAMLANWLAWTTQKEKRVLVPVAGIWWSHRDRPMYRDGLDLVASEPCPPGVFNLWRGFPVDPAPGDWGLIHDHLAGVVCGGDEIELKFLLDLLATWFQRPDKHGRIVPVLQGGEGSGKGIVGRLIRDLFGKHALHISDRNMLVGSFSGHLLNIGFIFADEAFFAGDRAGARQLKALITEDRLMIHPKGLTPFQSENRLKIIMATNEEHAIAAGPAARRFFVPSTSDHRIGDVDYFGRVAKAVKDPTEQAAFLHAMLTRDVSGFNPTRDLPRTARLAEQKRWSLADVDAWWLEILELGTLVHEDRPEIEVGDDLSSLGDWEVKAIEIDRAHVFANYTAWCSRPGNRYRHASAASPEGMWARLRKLTGKPLHRRQQRNGAKVRYCVQFPDLPALRKAFQAETGVEPGE